MSVLLSFFAIIAIHTMMWLIFIQMGWISFKEYGGLENLQATYNLISSVIFCVISPLTKNKEISLLYACLSFLTISFFIREIEVANLSLPTGITWLLGGTGFYIWQAIGWILFFLMIVRNFKPFFESFWWWLQSVAGFAMMLAATLLLATTPLDKKDFNIPAETSKLWEEIFEANAFLLILISALICISFKIDLSQKQPFTKSFKFIFVLAIITAIFASYPPFFLNLLGIN